MVFCGGKGSTGLMLSDDTWLDTGDAMELIDDRLPMFPPIDASLIFADELSFYLIC